MMAPSCVSIIHFSILYGIDTGSKEEGVREVDYVLDCNKRKREENSHS